jgi:hypothetical protein
MPISFDRETRETQTFKERQFLRQRERRDLGWEAAGRRDLGWETDGDLSVVLLPSAVRKKDAPPRARVARAMIVPVVLF